MQSCEMSGIWEIYLCKNLETWGKFFENNKKMAKKWLKMAKIVGKILGSNIYLCKNLHFATLSAWKGKQKTRSSRIRTQWIRTNQLEQ